MARWDVIKLATLGACALMAFPGRATAETSNKPNIIYIFTDQQSASMMSCTGNPWLKTPAMDYIAENGIRFTRAYTTNPVCSPARISLMTGRFAGTFSDPAGKPVRENRGAMRIPRVSDAVMDSTVAAFLKKAGYHLYYGGKEHLPAPLKPSSLGFTGISKDTRGDLAGEASRFILESHPQPYFLVISLINPHDICYMAIRDFRESDADRRLIERAAVQLAALDRALKMPPGVSQDEFFERYCPPLPPNYEPQTDEPRAVRSLIENRDFRRKAREQYTDKDWRRHRWAYCRLTESVDQHVQKILDAVIQSGQEEKTMILFSSDHGDMDAAHRMEHKSTLYEESANVPFLAMWKGQIPAGQVDDLHLVSTGLDLLPTLCDYAGIQGVSDPRGRSLRPLFEGKNVPWRDTLGVESEIGRMVVSQDRFKYIAYDLEEEEVQLLDLNRDPHETRHFTHDPAYASRLAELRKAFEQAWFPGH